jgi:hypothetical protein
MGDIVCQAGTHLMKHQVGAEVDQPVLEDGAVTGAVCICGVWQRALSAIVRDHQLFIARAEMERGLGGCVTGCADEVDPRHHLVFALDRQHVREYVKTVSLDITVIS